jgi:hypothetical protein
MDVATRYELDGRDSIPGKGKHFFLHSFQTGSGAHPASYPKDKLGSSLEAKAGRSMKLTIHVHPVPMSKMVELYLHSPINLHSFVVTSVSYSHPPPPARSPV